MKSVVSLSIILILLFQVKCLELKKQNDSASLLNLLGTVLSNPNNGNSSPTLTISNARNNSTIHSGFLVGTTSSKTVLVSIDGGAATPATVTGNSWSFQLPTGSSTWRMGSKHTVQLSNGISISLSLLQGKNEDINGDGFADLIVAAKLFNSGVGGAFIFLSRGSSGIAVTSSSGATSALTGSTANENMGNSTSLGDINGDGYADVAISALGTNSNQGSVFIFLSQGTSGISSQTDTTAVATLTGGASNDLFGTSIEIADMNSDGYSDLVVGAQGANATYIFQSSGSSGIGSGSIASAISTLTGSAGEAFGCFISTGDVNGDGYIDLAVGANSSSSGNGAAYVFLNSGSGIATTTNTSANSTLNGSVSGNFGIAGSLGDVNGDGYDDLAIGAYSTNSNNGSVYLYLSLGSMGLSSSLSDTSANSTFTGLSAEYFGYSLILSDTNNDLIDDLIVSGIS